MSDRPAEVSDLAARIDKGFDHDRRLRSVETDVASMKPILAELPRMEDRIMQAIKDNRPRSPWPAVTALASALGIVLIVAAAIYGG